MGHVVAKDIYGALGDKIDNLQIRTPQNEAFYAMLRELYSPDEADLIVRMPFTLSTLDRIAKVSGSDRNEIEPVLEGSCERGLVVGLYLHKKHHAGGEVCKVPLETCTSFGRAAD